MAYAKFSVFHWHIVDDESFPMELTSFPNVTKNGAYSAEEVYTKEMVKEVINYGKLLGLRVIPDFDNPGHTRSIGYDPEFAEIMRCFNEPWPFTIPGGFRVQGGPPTSVLDSSKEKTFDLIRGIVTDLNELFPDNMIMFGGDEVFTKCYDENPDIKEFMKKNNMSSYHDFFQYH